MAQQPFSSDSGFSTTGNVTADYILGNGSQLTGVTSSLSGNLAGNLEGNGYGANALSFVSTTGNVTSGNILTTGRISATGNITAGNIIGNINPTSNINGTTPNVTLVAGAYNWNFDNTGNLTLPANTFSVNYANGTTVTLGGNYGNAEVATFLADYGSNTVSTTGNITSGNILTTGKISATGNIISNSQIQSSAFTGGNISWSANNQTDFQGAIKVGGTGIIKGPGGASSITLNNNGANIPILGVTNTGNSTSTTTGALIVSGGAGVAGNVYAGNVYTAGQISATGNITTAGSFVGNGVGLTNVTVSAAGNIVGTSSNVSLVAGSYTYTFDNTGILTLPAMGGDEGAEINFGIPASNTTLSTRVVMDVYQDRLRIFDGNTKGAYIDLSQASTGVGTLLNNRVSGLVNAGTFVTMDNIKATVTTSANRGLSLATVSGSFTYDIGGTYATAIPTSSGSAGTGTLTTTPTASIFNWGFTNQGDTATYILTDTTNSRAYRITLQIGNAFNNNMISIERLI